MKYLILTWSFPLYVYKLFSYVPSLSLLYPEAVLCPLPSSLPLLSHPPFPDLVSYSLPFVPLGQANLLCTENLVLGSWLIFSLTVIDFLKFQHWKRSQNSAEIVFLGLWVTPLKAKGGCLWWCRGSMITPATHSSSRLFWARTAQSCLSTDAILSKKSMCLVQLRNTRLSRFMIGHTCFHHLGTLPTYVSVL